MWKIVLKVIVVDDELPARDELKYLLSAISDIDIIGETDNGPAAIALAASQSPDVVFLDVQMRGMNGIETAQVLRTIIPNSLIVFATAYDEYAIKAFEVGAVDYLLKPFDGERVTATIERIRKLKPEEWVSAASRVDTAILATTKTALPKLPVEKNGKIVLINYSDILYAHTQSGSVIVVTATGDYCYQGTLTDLKERLRDTTLMRVHKSFVVNMEKVEEVIPWFKGTYWLKLPGEKNSGVEIPVGKSQIKEIKDILGLK